MRARAIFSFVATAIGVYALVCGAMFLAQKSFLFHPTPSTAEPAAYGLKDFQQVGLTTRDGVELTAWLYDAPKAQKAVVFFYGNADALPPYSRFFAGFADAGYSMLGVNYRGYGGSGGKPSEGGFYQDGDAALAFMAARVGIENVTLIGRSIGSGVAVDLASRNPVRSLVLISPYTSIANVASKTFWWLPVGVLLNQRFPSIDKIKTVRAPLLVIHGSDDSLIPPSEGKALYAAANDPKRIEILEGADHIAMDLKRIGGLIASFNQTSPRL